MKKLVSIIMCALFIFGGIDVYGASERMVSTADFTYESFDTVTKRAKISFDINVNTVSDGIVGIASSTVTPKNYSDYAICFRIRSGGFFDSNNGNSFEKANDVYYVKNTTYHVEIDADIINQIYNAYVYIDGIKHIVADNYAFRASANDFGKITVRGGGGVAAGLYYIENIRVEQGEGEFETFVLPNVFCENMVLQRNQPHVVYGNGTGEIEVSLTKGNLKSSKVVVAENGKFKAELDPLPASLEPYILTVSTSDKSVVIEKVFIGDVFLLAGQSNMAQNYEHQTTEQLGNGVTTANMPQMITDDRIKHFKLSRTPSDTESFNVPFETDGWQPLNDSTKKKLSYIGMYFANERLKEEPNVPIGLMSVAWRGTTVNRWMRVSEDNKTLNYTPTSGNIYNNHIAPLVNYPISAVLWYQGESDSKNPVMYEEAFKTLINDWRRLWQDEDLPFLFVQLARYSNDNYAPLRDAQLKALELENTGMAVILDTDKGTYRNIHPLGKETVAERLYLLAKKYVYNEDIVCSGPVFESALVKEDEIIVSFKEETIGDGLCIKNTYSSSDTKLCEFEIADSTGYFVPADAVINQDNTITVSSPLVKEPKYVRYAYSAVPENPNLFNKHNLPASPFTTDERVFSGASFQSRGIPTENADVQRISFSVTLMKNGINGVMGFTDVNNTITAWNSAGITVRFHQDGFFEYIDGSNFVRSELMYNPGQTYSVDILADFTDNTYALIVDDNVLCRAASFRTGALSMNNLGRYMIRGGDGEAAEEFFVENVNLSSFTENTIIEANKNGEKVLFVIADSSDIYMADYEDGVLNDAVRVKQNTGMRDVMINVDKVFFWDENLKPKN